MNKHITYALIFSLGLIIPAGVQAASAGDQVEASFERDLNHEPVTISSPVREATDPAQYLINDALRSAGQTVVASFERDLNRELVAAGPRIRESRDPVQYLVNNALRQAPTQTVASSKYEPRS